jgi:hypothetical protein
MPITQRLYEKAMGAAVALPIDPTPSVTPSVTPSITVTPTISTTPSVTPSISITPSVTATPSVTPTPSTSQAHWYTVNIYNCSTAGGNINCGQFVGQTTVFSYSTNLSMSYYYPSSSVSGSVTSSFIYQPISTASSGSNVVYLNTATGYISCTLACSASLAS